MIDLLCWQAVPVASGSKIRLQSVDIARNGEVAYVIEQLQVLKAGSDHAGCRRATYEFQKRVKCVRLHRAREKSPHTLIYGNLHHAGRDVDIDVRWNRR